MEFSHHIYVCQRAFVARQFSQDEDILLSENHRDNGAGLVGTDKFGVHDNTGYTSVTIIEQMHITYHKHHENCTCKWVSQSCIILESLRECAFHKLMIHKLSHTGAIVLHFENTRIHVRSSFKQYAVAVLSIANISLGDIDVFFITARFDNSLNAPSMPCESSSVLAQHFSKLYYLGISTYVHSSSNLSSSLLLSYFTLLGGF